MTIPAQTAETENVYVGTIPTMDHLAIFSRLQLLAHIVRRMTFNPQLADHAARLQLGAASRCTTPSENKPTPPPGVNKKRGSYKNPSRLTGPRSTASQDMMVNTSLLLLLAISRRAEVNDASIFTLGLRNRKGWVMTRSSLTLDFRSQPTSAWHSGKLSHGP